jgi:hypothetical protein
MAKRRRSTPYPTKPVEASYDQALAELGITVPVAACRLVGNRLEFRLYGGRVLYWPPVEDPATMEDEDVAAALRGRPEEEDEC